MYNGDEKSIYFFIEIKAKNIFNDSNILIIDFSTQISAQIEIYQFMHTNFHYD